ncbi:MAG: hypothetical protein R3267_04345 [Paenisporosarcina sp.]|nr:hypothetical protein [Paenisporosarcina sp.]
MKYPCKECLVKTMCSKECKEYEEFMNMIQNIVVPLTMMVIGLLLISSFMGIIIYTDNETFKKIMSWIWGVSLPIVLLIDKEVFARHPIFLTMFAPLMAGCLIVWKTLAHMYKRK